MASVKTLDIACARKVIEAKHYSHRLGICWEAFGLFVGDELVGVVCYGQPSAPIQKYAFANRDFRLYELTRLVVDRGVKNGASMLIAGSLKLLSEQHSAVVSYADSAHGHCGIVYQATNWLYTGATVSHDHLYKVGDQLLHPMSIRDRFNVTNIKQWAKDNHVETVKPSKKYRYFKFLGTFKQRTRMSETLSYSIQTPYPKSDKQIYDDGPLCCEITKKEKK